MDIYETLKKLLCKQIKRKTFDVDKLTEDTSLDELGLDSLDSAELIINIEDEFQLPEISQEEMVSISKISDLKNLIEKYTSK